MARIDGIDISHWQSGVLDFHQAARAGVRFVAHKATEALNYRDPFHDRRRSEVGAAGLVFGGYHFARPGVSGGREQATYFLATAKPTRGDLRPILDLEDRGGLSASMLTRWVRDFVHEVREQTGVLPIIYTNFDLDDHFDCPRWAARYSNAMTPPNPARPWSTWTIWQFSNGVYGHPATVPGIGPCDINTLNTHDPASLLEQLVIGGSAARTVPEEDDMPTAEEVAKVNWRHRIKTNDGSGRKKDDTRTAEEMLAQTHKRAGDAREGVRDVAEGVGQLAQLIKTVPGAGDDLKALADDIVHRTAAAVERLDAAAVADRLDVVVDEEAR
ncbi:MAG TPA: glycoside hydrolase family 25 protein [Nocardioidaceae bacterium]